MPQVSLLFHASRKNSQNSISIIHETLPGFHCRHRIFSLFLFFIFLTHASRMLRNVTFFTKKYPSIAFCFPFCYSMYKTRFHDEPDLVFILFVVLGTAPITKNSTAQYPEQNTNRIPQRLVRLQIFCERGRHP